MIPRLPFLSSGPAFRCEPRPKHGSAGAVAAGHQKRQGSLLPEKSAAVENLRFSAAKAPALPCSGVILRPAPEQQAH